MLIILGASSNWNIHEKSHTQPHTRAYAQHSTGNNHFAFIFVIFAIFNLFIKNHFEIKNVATRDRQSEREN